MVRHSSSELGGESDGVLDIFAEIGWKGIWRVGKVYFTAFDNLKLNKIKIRAVLNAKAGNSRTFDLSNGILRDEEWLYDISWRSLVYKFY